MFIGNRIMDDKGYYGIATASEIAKTPIYGNLWAPNIHISSALPGTIHATYAHPQVHTSSRTTYPLVDFSKLADVQPMDRISWKRYFKQDHWKDIHHKYFDDVM